MPRILFSSRLDLSPAEFWAGQSLAAVNAELGPWLRMTAPGRWRDMRLQDWKGGPLFASWVMLLGILPIDRHAFGSFAFDPARGFVEHSSSWANRAWRHERIVSGTARGCTVTDQIDFTPRFAFAAAIVERVVMQVFRHRHNSLRARYGSTAG